MGNVACEHTATEKAVIFNKKCLEDTGERGGVPQLGQFPYRRGGVRVQPGDTLQARADQVTCSPSSAQETWGEHQACHRMLDKGLKPTRC